MKIISIGLLKPDDPIFTGRVEFFTIRKPQKDTPKDTAGEKPQKPKEPES